MAVVGRCRIGARGEPDREETTSAVHYVRFNFDEDEIEAFAAGPVSLAVNHSADPDGEPGTLLGDGSRAEQLIDLRGQQRLSR